MRQVSKSTLTKPESKSPGKTKKVKMPKPAWAMTKENAEVSTSSYYVVAMAFDLFFF